MASNDSGPRKSAWVSFWTSVPGVLIGIAAVITAVVSLIALTRDGDNDNGPSSTSPDTTEAAAATTSAADTTAEPTTATTIRVAEVPVPPVVGLGEEEAKKNLEALGFVVLVVERRLTEAESDATVLTQKPDSGTTAIVGSQVQLVVAEKPTVLIPERSLRIDADPLAEGLDRAFVDLDQGEEVSDATWDLAFAFGIEAENAVKLPGLPTYDECLAAVLENAREITWATTGWVCVKTNDERLARVRFIDAENISSTPLMLRYTIEFLTWEVPAGTF